jgi:hypothetical protein
MYILCNPRLNAAELITMRVNAVKALREKWKRGLEKIKSFGFSFVLMRCYQSFLDSER